MDGLSFIQDMYFWKILTKGFNFSKKKTFYWKIFYNTFLST